MRMTWQTASETVTWRVFGSLSPLVNKKKKKALENLWFLNFKEFK